MFRTHSLRLQMNGWKAVSGSVDRNRSSFLPFPPLPLFLFFFEGSVEEDAATGLVLFILSCFLFLDSVSTFLLWFLIVTFCCGFLFSSFHQIEFNCSDAIMSSTQSSLARLDRVDGSTSRTFRFVPEFSSFLMALCVESSRRSRIE